MPKIAIDIIDTDDCLACRERDRQDLDFLRTTKAAVLGGVTCSECGRELALVVADEGGDNE